MHLHRPSTGGRRLSVSPYDGWTAVSPPASSTDRVNASRHLAWLDARLATLSRTSHRAREKHAVLVACSGGGLEGVAQVVRDCEDEARGLESERRTVLRKLQNLERRDKERADAEDATRHRYHRLASQRTSGVPPGAVGLGSPGSGSSPGSARHSNRSSFGGGTPPGFDLDPSLAAAAASAPDLNLESPLDQELLAERVTARVRRDSVFEEQFGRLSIVAPPAAAGAALHAAGAMRGPRGRTPSSSRRHTSRSRASVQAQWIAEEGASSSSSSSDSSDTDSDISSNSVATPSAARPTSSSSTSSSRPRTASITSVDRTSDERGRMLPSPLQIPEEEPRGASSSADPSSGTTTTSSQRVVRPLFLTHAAELSAADLSGSLQNYLSHASPAAPPGVTATEALIDPNLREKIGRALQAYIASASAAALDLLRAMDEEPDRAAELAAAADAASGPPAVAATSSTTTRARTSSSSSSAAFGTGTTGIGPSPSPPSPPPPPALPSREEQLLWGLLMGTLRHEEEEQLAVEWWTDREAQLVVEAHARSRRIARAQHQQQMQQVTRAILRPTNGLNGPNGVGRLLSSSSSSSRQGPHFSSGDFSRPGIDGLRSPSHFLTGSSAMHAARGALLHALAVKEEELRQLRAGRLLSQLALRTALENQRARERLQTHGISQSSTSSSNAPPSSSAAAIEPMCRRFVLSVLDSALSNAGVLARQDRILRDLRWSLAKARRLQHLVANGSIDRPPEERPTWISAVSKPTLMPPLPHADTTTFLVVEPEEPGAFRKASTPIVSPSATRRRLLGEDGPMNGGGGTRQTRHASLSAEEVAAAAAAAAEEEEALLLMEVPTTRPDDAPSLFNLPAAIASTSVSGGIILPERDVRPGRGWTDPRYSPVEFDEAAHEAARDKGLTVAYPPTLPPRQRRVMKAPLHASGGPFDGAPFLMRARTRPTSATDDDPWEDDDTDGSRASSPLEVASLRAKGLLGMPREIGEDEETRAAIDSWLALQARDAAAAAARRQRAAAAAPRDDDEDVLFGLAGGRDDRQHGTGRGVAAPLALESEEPSLLGSPPGLRLAPALIDEWAHFVRGLDVSAQAARVQAAGGSPSPSPAAASLSVSGPSRDPTNKSRPREPSANERFALAATASANPFADIPPKHLPRGAYHGCTLAQPHPDKEPDVNSYMAHTSRVLESRARKLAASGDGGATLRTLRAQTASFARHFRPASNTWDWMPPPNAARELDDPAARLDALAAARRTQGQKQHAHSGGGGPKRPASAAFVIRRRSPPRRPATAASATAGSRTGSTDLSGSNGTVRLVGPTAPLSRRVSRRVSRRASTRSASSSDDEGGLAVATLDDLLRRSPQASPRATIKLLARTRATQDQVTNANERPASAAVITLQPRPPMQRPGTARS